MHSIFHTVLHSPLFTAVQSRDPSMPTSKSISMLIVAALKIKTCRQVGRFTPKQTTFFTIFGTLLFTLLGQSTQVLAAGGHEGWYQVELIVFARNYPDPQEHMSRNIKLQYPGRWSELKDPNAQMEPNIESQPSAASSIDLTKEPYYWLPSSDRSLDAQARKIERDSRYQLLFHQAWRQVITNNKSARSIIINGGKTFGQHDQLEGTIRLSVATYLKIQTNLWLSQFDVNVGQEQSTEWPAIPLRPNYRKAVSTEVSLNNSLDTQIDFEQALANENRELGITQLNLEVANEEEHPAYITRQIALVQQARDMRSNEVHYLDHPVLGVIIKIIPYSN